MEITREDVALAMKLHKYMEGLKMKPGDETEWAVHPKEFLPANVCCDFAGKQRFIFGLANIINDHNKEKEG